MVQGHLVVDDVEFAGEIFFFEIDEKGLHVLGGRSLDLFLRGIYHFPGTVHHGDFGEPVLEQLAFLGFYHACPLYRYIVIKRCNCPLVKPHLQYISKNSRIPIFIARLS